MRVTRSLSSLTDPPPQIICRSMDGRKVSTPLFLSNKNTVLFENITVEQSVSWFLPQPPWCGRCYPLSTASSFQCVRLGDTGHRQISLHNFNVDIPFWFRVKFVLCRPYWRCYYSNTDAIIYVVDSMDRDRIGISKQELVSMLDVSRRALFTSGVSKWKLVRTQKTKDEKNTSKFQEDELKKAILVVFANKQDIEGAMTVTEVANALGLPSLKNRKYQIFKTSAIKGEGLDEAMEWWAVFFFQLDSSIFHSDVFWVCIALTNPKQPEQLENWANSRNLRQTFNLIWDMVSAFRLANAIQSGK